MLLAVLVYVAFQPGFEAVTDGQLALYVVTVVCSALSVGGWVAWLSCRRLLARRGPTGQVMRWTIRWASDRHRRSCDPRVLDCVPAECDVAAFGVSRRETASRRCVAALLSGSTRSDERTVTLLCS
ncbi:MAG: DUF6328 family protein [Mycobacteriales bacterium]